MRQLGFALKLAVIWQVMWSSALTFAQSDPSTSLFVPSGRNSEVESDEDDSGSDRYTIRKPKSKAEARPAQRPVTKLPAKTTVTKTIKIETSIPPVVVAPKATPIQPVATSVIAPPVESAQITPPEKNEENFKFEDKIENLVLGAGQSQWEDYRDKLTEEDARSNILEFSIAPFYVYNDSASSFWPRKYNSFGTGYEFQASVWITPFFAFNTNYKSSLGHQIRSQYGTDKFVAVQNEWLDIGIRSRRFFDRAKEKTFLTFGLDFRDYQFKVPHDEPQRISLESSGIRLTIEGQLLLKNYATTFGFEVMPFVDHKESNTDTTLRTGGKPKAESFGLNYGGRWYFDRHNQVFWKLSHVFENNRFSGDTKTVDPKTGATMEGVSVTNNWSMFQMGYSWGD